MSASGRFDEQVQAYASFDVETVPLDAKLHDVATLLARRGVTALAVAGRDTKIVGMLSSLDVLAAVELEMSAEGPPRALPTQRRAEEVMARELVTIDERAPLVEAATAMVEHRIHRVWVKSGETITGVLTVHDLMRAVAARRIETPLREIMTPFVQSIDLGTPVREAVAQLAAATVHGLVVVDGGQPVGAFTRTEAIAARALPPALQTTPVERVMSYEVVSLDDGTPLHRAASHANVLRLRRIFVTKGGRLAGIATGFDFARFVAKHR